MDNLIRAGRLAFAISIAGLGALHFIYGNFPVALEPFPSWIPERSLLAYMAGAVLLISACCIIFKLKAGWASSLLSIVFFILALTLHGPLIFSDLQAENHWIMGFEMLALSGGAAVLAGTLPVDRSHMQRRASLTDILIKPGRMIFALSLAAFGILHIKYAEPISGSVPAWIPCGVCWVYFIGIAFLLTSVSILIKKKTRLAATLLGIMFLLWVLLLYIPRLAGSLSDPQEWTNAIIATALGGCSFVLADTMPKENHKISLE